MARKRQLVHFCSRNRLTLKDIYLILLFSGKNKTIEHVRLF